MYRSAIERFDAYLVAQGMPRRAAAIRREHVEAWVAARLETVAPATASQEYRALQQDR